MRITSGKASGISLAAPRGDKTRPATDAARQAIFSSLGGSVAGARVLDLFAGTGAYALEALSRGAASAVFVECDRHALACLKANIESVKKSLGGQISARAVCADCLSFEPHSESFDLIFADPPYDMLKDPHIRAKIFDTFGKLSSGNKDAVFILEAPAEFDFTSAANGIFGEIKRLGKKSRGKPSQIIFCAL